MHHDRNFEIVGSHRMEDLPVVERFGVSPK